MSIVLQVYLSCRKMMLHQKSQALFWDIFTHKMFGEFYADSRRSQTEVLVIYMLAFFIKILLFHDF